MACRPHSKVRLLEFGLAMIGKGRRSGTPLDDGSPCFWSSTGGGLLTPNGGQTRRNKTFSSEMSDLFVHEVSLSLPSLPSLSSISPLLLFHSFSFPLVTSSIRLMLLLHLPVLVIVIDTTMIAKSRRRLTHDDGYTTTVIPHHPLHR